MKTHHRLALIASLACLAGAVHAQEFVASQMGACNKDVQAHCPGLKPGGGRVAECLRKHQDKIAAACKSAVVAPSDFPASSSQQGSTLTVTIAGIESTDGFIWVTLGDNEEIFPRGRRTAVTPAKQGTVEVKFSRLKPGKYAVFAFHDANDNARMDTNALRLPSEGAGTSGGGMSFSASAFDVAADTRIKIEMDY
jgi:uncharacterized protein (DUF2141 family)